MIPELPPLPQWPASDAVEQAKWLQLASLHMQAARLESDAAIKAAVLSLTAEFSKVYPKMGAMEFDQAVKLIEMYKAPA